MKARRASRWVLSLILVPLLSQSFYPGPTLALHDDRTRAPEDRLYQALSGPGSDPEALFQILGTEAASFSAITRLENNYRAQYGDLISHLRSELSEDNYRQAMEILEPVIQDIAILDGDLAASRKIRSITPMSVQMVDNAIEVLAKGWAGMSDTERQHFLQFFDPADTGTIDDDFVSAVLENYRIIQREFCNDLVFEIETSSPMCIEIRRFYTYGMKIHTCPYVLEETDRRFLAQELVHEVTHLALNVFDRPYYSPHSKEYASLTPEGPWAAQLPVVGPILREILRSDTLYHPDAYAFFASLVG